MAILMAKVPQVPAYLAPTWRYASNDWSGSNALEYVVWQVAPVVDPVTEEIITPGVPVNLTGYTVSGTLSYRPSGPIRFGGTLTSNEQPGPAPVQPVGAVLDAVNGLITLSVPRSGTAFPKQAFEAWGNPALSLLLAEPMVTDGNKTLVTIGIQPVFVF